MFLQKRSCAEIRTVPQLTQRAHCTAPLTRQPRFASRQLSHVDAHTVARAHTNEPAAIGNVGEAAIRSEVHDLC
ncbi:unnamed protein product, partial [Iphiclides podalirius]